MNTKHTPGPWYVEGTEIKHTNGLIIAGTYYVGVNRRNEREANARLIAVAPELYALVRGYLTTYPHDTYNEKAQELINKIAGKSEVQK